MRHTMEREPDWPTLRHVTIQTALGEPEHDFQVRRRFWTEAGHFRYELPEQEKLSPTLCPPICNKWLNNTNSIGPIF